LRVFGQPVINSVSSNSTYPGDTIIISGSGFSPTSSNLRVWFGSALGNIVMSTDFSITVAVPPQAKYSNLEVINVVSGLSTRTPKKFQPYFSGNTFNPANMVAQTPITSPNQLFDLCSCDFNLDGKPDVAATKWDNALDILVLKNQSSVGTISFTAPQSVNAGIFTEEIVCGDLNGDGKPDMVASRSGGAAGGQRNSVVILPNTSTPGGAITFGAAVQRFFPTGHARYVSIRDLNLDGKPEIIASNSFNSEDLYIFINESSGGTLNINPTPIRIPVLGSGNSFGLEVQDFDGDGKPEIVFAPFQADSLFVLKNISTTSILFAPAVVLSGVAFQGEYSKIVSGDFNEDGLMDLAASEWAKSRMSVWINTFSGSTYSFSALPPIDSDGRPDGLDVGDVDGDKDLDIVIASRDQKFVDVFLNSGINTSVSFTKSQIATAKTQRNIILTDLDGDAKPEIAVTSYNSLNQYSIDIFRNRNCFVPELITQSPLTVCPTQTAILESIPGYGVTFEWKNLSTIMQSSASRTYATQVAGSYTVTALSESGCNNESTSIILNTNGTGIVPANPIIISNGPKCTGQGLQLSTAPVSGATYSWKGPNNFTATSSTTNISSLTIAAAGEYTLQIIQGTCKSNVISTIVDVVNLNAFTVSSNSVTNSTCSGSPLSLNTLDISGFTYQWVLNGANISGQTASNISVSTSGDYKVNVAFPAIAGCSTVSPSVSVKVLSAPTISFATTTSLCTSSAIEFLSAASTFDPNGSTVYAWSFGDGGTSNIASPTHTFIIAQAFDVALTGSYLGVAGCTASQTQSISISDALLPTITPSTTEICPKETLVLTVNGSFTDYAWSNGESGNPLSVNVSGDFEVTTTDDNGCVSSVSQTITDKPIPTISISASFEFVNSGEQVQLLASGGTTYSWTPTETLDNPLIANPMATPLSTTEYTVSASVDGQCTVEKSILITVNGDIKFPNIFSPNGDSKNDTWIIPGAETMADCTLAIFDDSGVRVVEQRANEGSWDGTYNGKPVPPGTYFYIINCPNNNPITGNILVAR
jgi:gliding motility-associated-like protein